MIAAKKPERSGIRVPGRIWAIVHQRCPVCRIGKVYHGAISMHPSCPVCGLRFERESGYFMGAMYISYAMAVVILTILMALVGLIAGGLSFTWIAIIATLLFLPLIPLLFRYSRVIWMHLDRAIDPERPGAAATPSAPGPVDELPRRNGHSGTRKSA